MRRKNIDSFFLYLPITHKKVEVKKFYGVYKNAYVVLTECNSFGYITPYAIDVYTPGEIEIGGIIFSFEDWRYVDNLVVYKK